MEMVNYQFSQELNVGSANSHQHSLRFFDFYVARDHRETLSTARWYFVRKRFQVEMESASMLK